MTRFFSDWVVCPHRFIVHFQIGSDFPLNTPFPGVLMNLGPVILGPVILGPVILGPVILGPVILGPVILGPANR